MNNKYKSSGIMKIRGFKMCPKSKRVSSIRTKLKATGGARKRRIFSYQSEGSVKMKVKILAIKKARIKKSSFTANGKPQGVINENSKLIGILRKNKDSAKNKPRERYNLIGRK